MQQNSKRFLISCALSPATEALSSAKRSRISRPSSRSSCVVILMLSYDPSTIFAFTPTRSTKCGLVGCVEAVALCVLERLDEKSGLEGLGCLHQPERIAVKGLVEKLSPLERRIVSFGWTPSTAASCSLQARIESARSASAQRTASRHHVRAQCPTA